MPSGLISDAHLVAKAIVVRMPGSRVRASSGSQYAGLSASWSRRHDFHSCDSGSNPEPSTNRLEGDGYSTMAVYRPVETSGKVRRVSKRNEFSGLVVIRRRYENHTQREVR